MRASISLRQLFLTTLIVLGSPIAYSADTARNQITSKALSYVIEASPNFEQSGKSCIMLPAAAFDNSGRYSWVVAIGQYSKTSKPSFEGEVFVYFDKMENPAKAIWTTGSSYSPGET